jgi:GH24 family phage-related lysozyme (muramidase)
MAEPRKITPNQTAGGIGALCVAAAAACISLTQSSEGFLPKAKPDPAHILTGCYGERVDQSDLDPNKVYSKSECGERLRNRLANEYAPQIAACLPQVVNEKRVKVFGALLDASFNAGPPRVCASPMALRIRAGSWQAACDALTAKSRIGDMATHGWFTTARYRGKPQPAKAMRAHGWVFTAGAWRAEFGGLVTRRQKEAALCREGAKA